MKATYVDIHIHTSENPNNLQSDYNVSELLCNVRKLSGDNPILLSLTDHNTINKSAYLKLINEDILLKIIKNKTPLLDKIFNKTENFLNDEK